jgi:hypothetical protein
MRNSDENAPARSHGSARAVVALLPTLQLESSSAVGVAPTMHARHAYDDEPASGSAFQQVKAEQAPGLEPTEHAAPADLPSHGAVGGAATSARAARGQARKVAAAIASRRRWVFIRLSWVGRRIMKH